MQSHTLLGGLEDALGLRKSSFSIPRKWDFSFGNEGQFTSAPLTFPTSESRCRRVSSVGPDSFAHSSNIWSRKPIERSSPLHLLNLPTEIRSQIYDSILISDESTNLVWEYWRMKGRKLWPLWNLTWTCRQIREEGFYHYFGSVKFTASIADLQNKAYLPWINQIADPGCAALRRLAFGSCIKVYRYVSAGNDRLKMTTVCRVFCQLDILLLHEFPFCSVTVHNLDIQSCLKGGSIKGATHHVTNRQTSLHDSVMPFYVSQRRAELTRRLQDMFLDRPLGTLRRAEIVQLMEFAAERLCSAKKSSHTHANLFPANM